MKKRVTKAEKKQNVINLIKTGVDVNSIIEENFCDYFILSYSKKSIFYIAIWSNSDIKPYLHSFFVNTEKREKYLSDKKEYYQKQYNAKMKEQQRLQTVMDSVKIGTVFYASWGHEQTNIQFYKVIERKKDFLLLQEVKSIEVCSKGFNDRGVCTPDLDTPIGEPFRKKLTLYGVRLESYKTASIYEEGKKLGWSSYA